MTGLEIQMTIGTKQGVWIRKPIAGKKKDGDDYEKNDVEILKPSARKQKDVAQKKKVD